MSGSACGYGFEGSCLLECDTIQSGRSVKTFQRILLLHYLVWWIRLLWNVSAYLPHCMALHPKWWSLKVCWENTTLRHCCFSFFNYVVLFLNSITCVSGGKEFPRSHFCHIHFSRLLCIRFQGCVCQYLSIYGGSFYFSLYVWKYLNVIQPQCLQSLFLFPPSTSTVLLVFLYRELFFLHMTEHDRGLQNGGIISMQQWYHLLCNEQSCDKSPLCNTEC
jgi:hypothetical protein